MGLRLKILSGFIILVLMLLIAGVWSILEIRSMGSNIDKLLKNNYRSITAAKTMKETLEREDSAILLSILGDKAYSKNILSSADSLFKFSFDLAKANITIEGEEKLVDDVENNYKQFKDYWIQVIWEDKDYKNLEWYSQNIHASFLNTVKSIDNLLNLNDVEMYRTALNLNERSQRAIMPGIVAIIAAIVFTILFNFFINYYVITPIIEITNRVKKFTRSRTPFDYSVETKDELNNLTGAVSILCSHVLAEEQSK